MTAMAKKLRIKRGDQVVVISGKDRGKRGEVVKVIPKEDRLVVAGVNQVKRHTRPSARGASASRSSRPCPAHAPGATRAA